jgi:hypothetical protein
MAAQSNTTHGLPDDMIVVDCHGCGRLLASLEQILKHKDKNQVSKLGTVFKKTDVGLSYCAPCFQDADSPGDGPKLGKSHSDRSYDGRDIYDDYHGYCRDDC